MQKRGVSVPATPKMDAEVLSCMLSVLQVQQGDLAEQSTWILGRVGCASQPRCLHNPKAKVQAWGLFERCVEEDLNVAALTQTFGISLNAPDALDNGEIQVRQGGEPSSPSAMHIKVIGVQGDKKNS